MILGKSLRDNATDSPFRRSTLDDLFRRAVERHGDAVALIDPSDRTDFAHGAPRRLTYAEADRAVSAIAARLIDIGLNTDAIIALQLPNTVESVLTLLGVMRAGMIAAPLPLLWRQIEAVDALSRIGARALVTCSRIGPVDHGELAMHIAAETFTIRFLCAFGEQHLDGVVALDDVFTAPAPNTMKNERPGNPADHVAVVTFDIAPDGLVPVARNHAELIAGGLAVVLESRIGHDNAILGALATSSFAGLSTTVVPWLLSGGTLTLHQPFNGLVLAAQCRDRGDVAVLPGPLIPRMTEAALIGGRNGPRTVLSVWRAPERVAGSAPWPRGDTALVDVMAFGEIGVIAIRRQADGKPLPMTPGPVVAPQSQGEGLVLAHIRRTQAATIALSGAMVPHHPFPPGVERSGVPRLKIGDDGFIDTGYACRPDRNGTLTVNAPPAGIVSVGGYRFVLRELQQFVTGAADGSTLAALPDGLAGHRLAGVASDRNSVRRVLTAQGANPLIVAAFRERRGDRASAA
jgi:AMP-binding enzyme